VEVEPTFTVVQAGATLMAESVASLEACFEAALPRRLQPNRS